MKNIFLSSLFAVLLFSFLGCRQVSNKKNNFEEDGLCVITFGVEGGHGKIYAEMDGAGILSGLKIEKGKEIIFQADPESGYIVEAWTNAKQDSANSNKAILKVTSSVHVRVKFKEFDLDLPKEFIVVPVPEKGIKGKSIDYPLSSERSQWKGVFIAGRSVKLSAYAISKFEVTYRLWKEVYDWAKKKDYTFANEGRMGGSMENSYNPSEHTDDEPVTQINWRDCIVWCNAYTEKINGNDSECVYFTEDGSKILKNSSDIKQCDRANMNMEKRGFRLPTEAEWEFAARYSGGDKTNSEKYGGVYLTKLNSISGAKKPIGFPAMQHIMGSETWETLRDEADLYAVYRNWWNGSDWYPYSIPETFRQTGTSKIKSRKPNALGLYDMSGNVWEWCFDKNGEVKEGDYTDPANSVSSDSHRIQRGGGWQSGAILCAVGFRGENEPERKSDFLGFRLAVYIK